MRSGWKPTWRLARRLAQVACLVAFLWLFRRTEYDGFRDVPDAANIWFRLDPLTGASAMLGDWRLIPSLLVPGAIVLILTFILGRFFCGWLCPLGTILDLSGRLLRAFGHKVAGWGSPPPSASSPERLEQSRRILEESASLRRWARIKHVLLVLILVSAAVGLPLVGYFDPFSLLVRTVTFAVDPVFTHCLSAPFDWLYRNASENVQVVSERVYEILRSTVLPVKRTTYLLGVVSFTMFLGIVALEAVQRRFWCRNLCPLGALLSLAARASLLRRWPFKSCKGCLECAASCRMGAFDPESRMAPESCNLCMDCIEDCPHGMVTFRFVRHRDVAAPFDPSRRLVLGAAGTGLALAAVSSIQSVATGRVQARVLRPPGVKDEETFLGLCVRCGLCMKVCLTGGLQPTWLESGWEGMFSPRLIPRLGYCEYNCTLCGQVCPTGAIPPLSKEEKHHAVLGKAEFDRSRCLPYARGEPCIVCEEHCPLPEKAIQTRETEVVNLAGQKVTLLQPFVELDRCTGCGICENKCPVQAPAGIRVVHTRDAAITAEMAGRSTPSP